MNAAQVVVEHGADGFTVLINVWWFGGAVQLLDGFSIILTKILKVALQKQAFWSLWGKFDGQNTFTH